MLEAILGAAVLGTILAISVLHMPRWFKKAFLKIPDWFQAVLLHFGYAGWIGGVSGHLMGAPLAIMWFGALRFWIRPELARELGDETITRKDFIKTIVEKVKGFFDDTKEAVAEVQTAVATA